MSKWYSVIARPLVLFDVQADSAKEAEEKIFREHYEKDWKSNAICDVSFEVEEITGDLDLWLAEKLATWEEEKKEQTLKNRWN